MKFVVLTGMSGAGKSTALKVMEDSGYFCVDNLPIVLMEKFAELANVPGAELQKVAIGVDIRSGRALNELQDVLDRFRQTGIPFDILYLDSRDGVLVKRYKETRRSHPLAAGERVDRGIQRERERLEFLKKQADYIIDTSNMLTRELKGELEKIFVQNQDYKNLFITIVSFGFKYGIPTDSDLVFDVRFLPNPYYIAELRHQTGLDAPVYDFVFGYQQTKDFMTYLERLIGFLLPQYVEEGKTALVIAIGCTGGKHRSVAIARALADFVRRKGYDASENHRDMTRG